MIQTKEDLNFYLREDAKRNGVSSSPIIRFLKLIAGLDNYKVYNYLRILRKCEYHYNNKKQEDILKMSITIFQNTIIQTRK